MKEILCSILVTLLVASCQQAFINDTDHSEIVLKRSRKTVLTQEKKAKTCSGKPIVIAVIDTGYGHGSNFKNVMKDKLCKFGHKNFVNESDTTDGYGTSSPVPLDDHGHGTNIAGIIGSIANGSNINYCLVILKYYNPSINDSQNLQNTIAAINYARQIKADFINYSGGGLASNPGEIEAVKKYIDEGGKFVAAAGNESKDLAVKHYYPAEDDSRVIVVGNGFDSNHRDTTSNYGDRVNAWEDGHNVSVYGHEMTGTSQATAIHTGKMVVRTNNFCK